MKSILMMATLSLSSMHSIAKNNQITRHSSDSLTSQITILNQVTQAAKQNEKGNVFLVKQTSYQLIFISRGYGKLASVREHSDEKKTNVIGKDVQGYQQIALESFGGNRIKIKTDQNFTTQSGRASGNMNYKIEQVGIITKGTWESFQAGGQIEFKVTKSSEKETRKEIGKQFAKTLTDMLEFSNLGNQISFDTQVSVSEDGIDDSYCTAGPNALECVDSKIKIDITVDINGL